MHSIKDKNICMKLNTRGLDFRKKKLFKQKSMKIESLSILLLSLLVFFILLSCHRNEPDTLLEAELAPNGLYGYLGYDSKPDPSHGMGVSFYTAAWALIDQPLSRFQIGFAIPH